MQFLFCWITMKTSLITLLLCCSALLVNAQMFPALHCETLADQKLNIPQDVQGKRSVVCLAMSPKAEKLLRSWNNPLYNALIAEGMGGLMGGRMYNANLCFVGMLKGIAKLGLNEAKNQSKKDIEKKLHSLFMISADDVTALMKTLQIDEVKEPHFYVLDEKGNILFHTSGEFSDAKLDQITEKLMP